jgi:hypothetical protein
MKTGVAYFHPRDPRHAERDLDDMVEHGCTFMVYCFSETDMAYYNQATEKILRMSHDRGLEVYLDPWGLGGMYGGETFSRFVAEHLGARQTLSQGQSVPAACPNQPEFRDFQDQWIRRAAEMGTDVVFWDEPHFHFNFMDPSSWTNWACRCDACRDRFQELTGLEMPAELTPEVVDFRQRSITEFLEENCREARRLGMQNCVCVLPDEEGSLAQAAGTPRWEQIVSLPQVDLFGTDPYWVLLGAEVREYVRKHSIRVKELCDLHGKEPQAWVQAFLIPEDREEEVGTAAQTIYDVGIRNIAAWAYRGCHLIDIRCARPDKVWEILTEAYLRFQTARG